ncbi:MAG: hypothetical protein M3P23_02055 [Actinomycetota bacterium]|nr:hypothetical protein [Actinomycetota bacterium]
MTAKHRGGRRTWQRRVPGVLVAVLAAASAVGVVGAALRGTGTDAAAVGAAGAAVTLSGGGITRARRHRGHHRVSSANPPTMALSTDALLQPAVAVAMSAPPLPGVPMSSWAPPALPLALPLARPIDLRQDSPTGLAPSLFIVPDAMVQPASSADPSWQPDPMVDTVPHPVVKLFPLAGLEPDLAAGSIDDRVYAAFDAERRHLEAAAMAGGKHASHQPTDAAAPRSTSYRSRHSA